MNVQYDKPWDWRVHPSAKDMLEDYLTMDHFYGFDERFNATILRLNVRNMNLFLNSFAVPGVFAKGGLSAKAQKMVNKNFLGVGKDSRPANNAGLKWWQTKDCERDHDAVLGAAPEERARSHSRPRGRSRTTRELRREQSKEDEGERTKDGVPAEELWRLLDLMRLNPASSKDYTEQDLMDLLHMVVKGPQGRHTNGHWHV